MFNSEYKKEALAEAERTAEKYSEKYEDTVKKTNVLYEGKKEAISILNHVEEYINSLANKPWEVSKVISEISFRRQNFEKEVSEIEIESKKADKINSGVAGAGAVAGAGVAAFGPSAAMAIATTFGTASTGTAIATLSGAAATNAALAWLGGGTVALGGGGMAAGEAFLAMAGPVGWAIGGAALIGGGLMANSKNKKIAEKAERQAKEMKTEIDKLRRIDAKVLKEIDVITPLNKGISLLLDQFLKLPHRDYKRLYADEKDLLLQLVNSSESLSKGIARKIE